MKNTSHKRPGDYIIDKYCPHLSPEDRELARERLDKLAGLLVRIAMRQAKEELEAKAAGGIPTPSLTPHQPRGTLEE